MSDEFQDKYLERWAYLVVLPLLMLWIGWFIVLEEVVDNHRNIAATGWYGLGTLIFITVLWLGYTIVLSKHTYSWWINKRLNKEYQ